MARATRDKFADTVTFNAALKRKYDDMFQEQYATWWPVIEFIKSKGNVRKVPAEGEKIYFGAEMRLGAGGGPAFEGQVLRPADSPQTTEGSVDWNRGFKGRLQLTAEALKFMKKGKGSYVDALKQETRGLVNTIKMSAAPAIWGLGKGVLGRVNGGVSDNASVTVDSSELSGANGMLPGTRWLYEGQRIDLIASASLAGYTRDSLWVPESGVSQTAKDRIISITGDTTFTLGAANSANDDAWIVDKDSYETGTAGVFGGPQGLLAMVDDDTMNSGDYCGISSSDWNQWKAVIKDNSGTATPLTLRMLYDLYNAMVRKNGKAKLDLKGFTNWDLFQEVVDLLEHFVQFKPRKLEGGWSEATIGVGGGSVLSFDRDIHAPGGFFLLDPKAITLVEGCPLEVVDEDGATMPRVADYDAFEMRYRWLMNLYTTKRNAHGALYDISYTVGSVV